MTHIALGFESFLLIVLLLTVWQASRLQVRLTGLRKEHEQLLEALEQLEPVGRGHELTALSTLRTDLLALIERIEDARSGAREEAERLAEQVRLARVDPTTESSLLQSMDWSTEKPILKSSKAATPAISRSESSPPAREQAKSQAERDLTRHLAALRKMAAADA